MKKNEILIFTATYNEKLNISDLCSSIIDLSPNYDVLVIDDNSTDGTKESLEKLASDNSRLTVINRPKKMGVGSAHKAAMIYAMKNGYEKLVTMDADFSHSPKIIPLMLEKLKTSDFVIGSRYMLGGECDYTGFRKWVSIIANEVARFFLGIEIHECTTSFRAFRVSLFNSLNLSDIKSSGYSFFLECVYRIKSANAELTEVPIHFTDRLHGKSKIPKTEIFRSMYKLVNLFQSKFFQKQTDLINPAEIKNSCYFCNSSCLVEVFHENYSNEVSGTEAYRCTSLEHKSKPQVLNCLICDLSFVPEKSYPENIEAIYSDVEDPAYIKYKKARYKTFRKALHKISPFFPNKGHLLDVGAYCGFFLKTFNKSFKSWDTTGIEPSKWASEYGIHHQELDIRTGTLEENISQLNKDYDAVVSWDVLEHVKDPLAFLTQINSIMKQNGVFCFSTLDVDNWFPKLMGKHWPWLMDMHLFYFNRNTTEQFLNRAGFKIVRAHRHVHYISIQYFAEKINAILPYKLGSPFYFIRKVMPQNLLVPFSFGDIKIYICVKEQ